MIRPPQIEYRHRSHAHTCFALSGQQEKQCTPMRDLEWRRFSECAAFLPRNPGVEKLCNVVLPPLALPERGKRARPRTRFPNLLM